MALGSKMEAAETFVIPAIALALAVCVWRANRFRRANQSAAIGFMFLAIWTGLQQLSVASEHGLRLYRLTVCVGTFAPAVIWFLRLALEDLTWRAILKRSSPLIVLLGLISILPWLEWFVPSRSTRYDPIYGGGYLAYAAVMLAVFVTLCWKGVLFARRAPKRRRAEFVYASMGGSALGLLIVGKMLLSGLLGQAPSASLSLILAGLFAASTMFGLGTQRLFGAEHVSRLAAKATCIGAAVGAASAALHSLLEEILPTWLLFGTLGLGGVGVYALLEPWLERLIFRRPAVEVARHALHRVARTCLAEAQLVTEASEVLEDWADSSFHLITPTPEPPSHALIHLLPEDPIIGDLQAVRWVTPERLHREPPSDARDRLVAFLDRNLLSAAVISEGSDPPVILAPQRRPSLRPVTYPEIRTLLEFSAILQLALARVRLVETAMHADRLSVVGIVGATLAHEIRNPLHAIRTFAEMLPAHYDQPDFRHRFSHLIGNEVSRIDHLVSQLAQMASPRRPSLTPANFNGVVAASLDLVRLSLERKNITIESQLHPLPSPFSTDAGLVRQVILNLCLNAGHALADHPGPRWIHVSTSTVDDGIRLTVSDNGPGLPSAIQARLFQRFVSLSDRGLGLGLTISREAMLSLGGSLQYDAASSAASGGTVFHAHFPLPADANFDPDSARVAAPGLALSSVDSARPVPAQIPAPVGTEVPAQFGAQVGA
jgi:signal transduction histidine kinase